MSVLAWSTGGGSNGGYMNRRKNCNCIQASTYIEYLTSSYLKAPPRFLFVCHCRKTRRKKFRNINKKIIVLPFNISEKAKEREKKEEKIDCICLCCDCADNNNDSQHKQSVQRVADGNCFFSLRFKRWSKFCCFINSIFPLRSLFSAVRKANKKVMELKFPFVSVEFEVFIKITFPNEWMKIAPEILHIFFMIRPWGLPKKISPRSN